MLTFCIIARRKKQGYFDGVTVMLIVNIVVLLGLLAFEFGTEYIAGFWIMILASNYLNFIGFTMLLRHLPTPERHVLRKKTNIYLVVMNLLYIVLLSMFFFHDFGPWCDSAHLYPQAMYYLQYVFALNAIFHYYLHFGKPRYGLLWEESPEV